MAAALLNSHSGRVGGRSHVHHLSGAATTSGRAPCAYVQRRHTFGGMCRLRVAVRALGSGLGDQYMQSPFSYMDAQMQLMNEQMRAMDREFAEMDQMMKRDIEDTLQSSRRLTEQLNKEVEQELQKARDESTVTTLSRPNIQIERSEQRAPGSYRYYESIQIRSGYAPYQTLAAEPAALSSGPSAAFLAAALILAGAWAAVTSIFHKNYDTTTFKPEARWKLYASWPVLLLFSAKFRQQFIAAFQGRAPPSGQENGSQGDSS